MMEGARNEAKKETEVYTRILHPSNKRDSYPYWKTLLEPPKYSLQVYIAPFQSLLENRFLSWVNHIKIPTLFIPRNKKLLYSDCPNFYFEIEQEYNLKTTEA